MDRSLTICQLMRPAARSSMRAVLRLLAVWVR